MGSFALMVDPRGHAGTIGSMSGVGLHRDMPPTDLARPREVLNATPGLQCDFPLTAKGKLQRSGYPDLRITDLESKRVFYLDPKLYVVGFASHVDAGCPYIQIGDDQRLHWIVKERGRELEHRTTREPDELLYWSFQATTFGIASNWAARHRDESQDFRVGLWAKQAELLHQLNPVWAQRWRRELAARQPRDIGLIPQLPPEPGHEPASNPE